MHHFALLKYKDLKLANGTLDETTFAHTTTLKILKMSRLRNISQNIFAHETTFNSLE
jgi:hypothetical protein